MTTVCCRLDALRTSAMATAVALALGSSSAAEAQEQARAPQVQGLERMALFASITNLLDEDPPFSGNNGFSVGGVNATFFDALGRSYRIGVRMSF